MKCLGELDIEMSDELQKFIDQMYARGGNPRFQIQDVQESIHDSMSILTETEELRKKHGNFWIIFGRVG
jgi:hypothetical protein